jgi:FSR family fosmidomycin resistance protein-like MFS transporter
MTPRLALLSSAHFTVDAYSSFLAPLLPLLVTKLSLSLTSVGSLVALSSMASSLSQPLFGMWADRLRRPWFVVLGPLLAAVFLGAVGLAPSYTALAACVVLGGLGAAAFHPQAAVLASGLSERRAIALSYFVTGGSLGFACGPLFAVTVVSAFGLSKTWLAAIPGIMVASLLLAWFTRVAPHPHSHMLRPSLGELKPVWKPLSLIYGTGVFRSAVSYGFMTFMPLLLHRKGFSVAAGGTFLTLYLGAGAVGGFLGGWAADRWGGRAVLVRSFAGALPLYLSFLFLPIAAGLVALVLGCFILQSSLPVNVTMGQELSPRHASTISSLLMGAAWGVGQLMAGPIGVLADARGLETALFVLASLLAFGLACALGLPRVQVRHEVAIA